MRILCKIVFQLIEVDGAHLCSFVFSTLWCTIELLFRDKKKYISSEWIKESKRKRITVAFGRDKHLPSVWSLHFFFFETYVHTAAMLLLLLVLLPTLPLPLPLFLLSCSVQLQCLVQTTHNIKRVLNSYICQIFRRMKKKNLFKLICLLNGAHIMILSRK